MKILFMTRKGDGLVGAPSTYHGFEMAVGEQTECKWAGEGWPLYNPKEDRLNDTVRRVMPDADWVIMDKNEFKPVPENRFYKTAVMISDLHGKYSHGIRNPMDFMKLINKCGYDAVFMKYLKVYGTDYTPTVFTRNLTPKVHHLPWSVDPKDYRPRKKTIDASFIGAHGPVYPLRSSMWNGILHACRGRKVVRTQSPKGKTFERDVDGLKTEHYVGEKYADVLGRTKMMLFGSSKYRYFVQKYVEAMMSGCVILSDMPSDGGKLGLKHVNTFVEVDEYNWEEELLYCMENYEEIQQIGKNARSVALAQHSHQRRAEQFLYMLDEH